MHQEKSYRRIQLGFAAAAICISFFVAITYMNMQHSVKVSLNVRTALQNLLNLENVLTEVQAVETGQRGYMLTGDEKYLVSHNTGLENIKENIDFLTSVNNYDSAQSKERRVLAKLIDQKIINSKYAVALRKNFGYDSAAAFLKSGQGESLMNQVKNKLHSLEEIDRRLLKEANIESEKAAKVTTWQFVCLAVFFYIILYFNYKVIINDFRKKQVAEDRLKYILDLSEKVKSQQQLVESEEKFKTLIEQASDGIFISNQMGDYLVVNSSAALLTGYTKEELLEMNMHEVIFEKNMEPNAFRVKELLSGQTVINEKLIKQKNGNMINVEISSKLLADGSFQGIVRDITARKLAEEGLRYSEEKRRLIMNASLDAIICMDTGGLVTFWNPPAEKIFGWKAEEIYGKRLSEIIIPEKFREMHEKRMDHYSKTGEGNVFNKVLELSAINRSGEEFPIELTVLPIKQGNEEFFCAFIRDITSRKNTEEEIRISEHKYRLLFDQNPMPMWMISLPERNFLAVNASAVEFYGYSKEEFLEMNIKDLRPDEEVQNGNKVISTYKSGINNTGIWEHKKKDGTLVKVNLITHDIIYQGKHAKLVLANDMTEKIRAEEKLKNSNSELRQLATHLQNIRESERTHMAREIHDELGQQLTGLKMDISWINRKLNTADSELKQKMADTLKLIDGTVRTVRRIATQLRPSILDDLGIVAAMEWQSEEFQKRSEIETIFTSNVSNIDISSELVTGFFRIFQESLTNVLRHSKATKVEAMLSIKDGLLILNITDNGVGFNAKEIKNKKTLGLLGMKERTLIMGGSYEITSKPGKGTTVVIIVPIQSKV